MLWISSLRSVAEAMALSFTLLVMFIFLCQTEKPGSKRDYDGVPWLDQEVYGKSQDT